MKIAMFVPSWPPGSSPNGIVTYASYMVPALRKLGNEVFVLTHAPQEADPYTVDLREFQKPARFWDRIMFRVAPEAALFNAATSPLVSSIKYLIQRHGIEILEMEDTFGLSYAVSKLDLIPVIVRLHGPWFLNKRSEDANRERREERAIKAAQVVTSPSRDTLDRVKQQYGLNHKARHIENPIELPLEQWSLTSCDKNSILFVGRFDKIKGGDLVLRAFGQLAASNPSLRLTFVGPDDGIDGINFETYAKRELSTEAMSRVRYLGPLPQSELTALRLRHLLTVAASRYEVFGYTVLEAMSLGCPIVASAVGGIPELVHHTTGGLLFDPHNEKGMVSAIQKLLDDHSLAETLGHNARRRSVLFRPDQIGVYTAEMYRQEIKEFPFRDTVYEPDQHEYY